MLILNVFLKKLIVILSVVQIVHIQDNIKIMLFNVVFVKKFSRKLFCTEEKMLFMDLLNQFLMSTIIV